MTDTPEQPVEEPEADKLEMLSLVLQETAHRIVAELRRRSPELKPVFVASEIIAMVGDALAIHMGPAGVQQALLYAFEATHEHPMNFIDTARAKEALGAIAAHRRKVVGANALIIGKPN